MRTLYFCNPGVFDVDAMLTFGVNAKTSNNAIGYFGTGFKYAVAIVLRLGGNIKVTTGGKDYVFTTRPFEMRGKEFDVVYCNDERAGFTTRLGLNWEPWQAFRELYCNALDENGDVSTVVDVEADTVVTVNCLDVYAAYLERHLYFLSGDPILECEYGHIFAKSSQYVYYRGVAVLKLPEPALFSYSINDAELTEDRTLKHEYQYRWGIQKLVQQLKDKAMIRAVIQAPQNTYEHSIEVDSTWATSDEVLDIIDEYVTTKSPIPQHWVSLLRKKRGAKADYAEFELTAVQKTMVERAFNLLKQIDVDPARYPIRFVESLGEGVMGKATGTEILVAKLAFNMGTKQVCSTILEEYVHNSTGYRDCTRSLQSWLFDKILTLGEEIAGEPL